jgi:GTP1/Obg family GTP-binding protein
MKFYNKIILFVITTEIKIKFMMWHQRHLLHALKDKSKPPPYIGAVIKLSLVEVRREDHAC